MAIDEIPKDKLFTPIPLVARLTSGVTDVLQLVKRQRESVKSSAISPPKG